MAQVSSLSLLPSSTSADLDQWVGRGPWAVAVLTNDFPWTGRDSPAFLSSAFSLLLSFDEYSFYFLLIRQIHSFLYKAAPWIDDVEMHHTIHI